MNFEMRLACLLVFAAAAPAQDAEKLIKASDCSSCHAVDHQVVGADIFNPRAQDI